MHIYTYMQTYINLIIIIMVMLHKMKDKKWAIHINYKPIPDKDQCSKSKYGHMKV